MQTVTIVYTETYEVSVYTIVTVCIVLLNADEGFMAEIFV